MVSLFSVFDPSSVIFSMNWLIIFLVLGLLSSDFWVWGNRFIGFWKSFTEALMMEFFSVLGMAGGRSVVILIFGFLYFILLSNMTGLIPYVFTSTAHVMVTLSLVFPVWVGMMLYGWINHTIHMLAHLVPYGTPSVLLVFMVLIESISMMIRPITLSIRLAANMISGHILLVLLGSGVKIINTGFFIVLSGEIMLLILEFAVAGIQAYVFVLLLVLYYSEV